MGRFFYAAKLQNLTFAWWFVCKCIPLKHQLTIKLKQMKTFRIKAYYKNGYEIADISGKDLGHAFYEYFKRKSKIFTVITGFDLIEIIK